MVVAMKINDRHKKNLNHSLDLIDGEKTFHKVPLLVESNGLTVDLKRNETWDIDQNLIHVHRDINWKQYVIGDRTFKLIDEGKLTMKVL